MAPKRCDERALCCGDVSPRNKVCLVETVAFSTEGRARVKPRPVSPSQGSAVVAGVEFCTSHTGARLESLLYFSVKQHINE
ncbi:hypothetical protein ACOMHN_004588 [Nucella lapillus]